MNYRIYRGKGLTPKQQELLDYLRTLDEIPQLKLIAAHFNDNTSRIAYHGRMKALVQKGYLVKQPLYRVKDPAED